MIAQRIIHFLVWSWPRSVLVRKWRFYIRSLKFKRIKFDGLTKIGPSTWYMFNIRPLSVIWIVQFDPKLTATQDRKWYRKIKIGHNWVKSIAQNNLLARRNKNSIFKCDQRFSQGLKITERPADVWKSILQWKQMFQERYNGHH